MLRPPLPPPPPSATTRRPRALHLPALAAALSALVGACAGRAPAPAPAAGPATSAVAPAAVPTGDQGFDLALVDRSVAPCDDFYRFACGGWLKTAEIPADRPRWGRSFDTIHDRNEALLHQILDEYAAGKVEPSEPDGKRVGDLYAACMDEAQVETSSRAVLDELFGRIAAIKDGKGLAAEARWLQDRGIGAFFHFSADQDFKDATQVIGAADQGGLGLPDRDFYIEQKSADIRKAYQTHVARMLELAGDKPDAAARGAQVVMSFETALAQVSMPRVDRRDPVKVYHRLERTGLEKAAPRFVWASYFTGDLAAVQAINVATPEFFKGLSELLGKSKLDDLKTVLRWNVVHGLAELLGKRFVDESFAFRATNLTGAKENLPRWKRCAATVDGALGEALAQPFVRRSFGEDGKQKSLDMIGGIESAFARNVAALPWMDDETRRASVAKAEKIMNKIGYPERWRSYATVDVDRGRLAPSVMAAAAFESARQHAKIGRPVERAEWGMTPPTVNAYYNAQLNEMVFPAGILQPPFFVRSAGEAANLGGIGMVMGHELTHGFDDEGRKFDGIGNLRDWWTPTAGKAYEERAACVVKQYDAYVAVADLHVNGKLTLGENIADLGGLKLAYLALESRQARRGRGPDIGGFSEEQQFFLAFAQGWCSKRRDAYAKMLVTVDPHSPSEHRVNGPVTDLPAFAQAFSCPAGAPMAPRDRCSVW